MFRSRVQTHRASPLTGERDAVVVAKSDRHGHPLRNVCWLDSGFVGVDPIPTQDVEDFYRKEYRQNYKGSVAPRPRHILRAARVAMHRLEQISAVFPRILEPRLVTLDAGASSGEFVFLMQELGHDATGLEAHEGYASHARGALGLNVENGVFSSFTPGRKRFDLITMFHVLEHLEFPVEELERLSEALSDTGIFVLEVPNILHRGMRFSHKWHSAHLSGFSQRTFEATALRAGLHPLLSGETEDGANLFGIFRKGEKISSESVRDQLGGAQPELDQLVANSDSDYFSRTSTWLKIGPKLFSQVEERWTSSRFSNGAEILKAVYRGIL